MGLRFDRYDGISYGTQLEPWVGASYLIASTFLIPLVVAWFRRASFTQSLPQPKSGRLQIGARPLTA
jgi:membrane associated rhomboid family serine protease